MRECHEVVRREVAVDKQLQGGEPRVGWSDLADASLSKKTDKAAVWSLGILSSVVVMMLVVVLGWLVGVGYVGWLMWCG